VLPVRRVAPDFERLAWLAACCRIAAAASGLVLDPLLTV